MRPTPNLIKRTFEPGPLLSTPIPVQRSIALPSYLPAAAQLYFYLPVLIHCVNQALSLRAPIVRTYLLHFSFTYARYVRCRHL